MGEIAPKESNTIVKSFDLSRDLPDLQESREVPADLSGEYWSPEKEGEFKLGFIQKIEVKEYQDFEDKDVMVGLPTMHLLEQRPDRSLVVVRNASKRLVSAIEQAFKDGKIEEGTPVKITYLGEKKNKNNNYDSHRWSIRPLSL